MLFLSYWELNEQVTPAQRVKAMEKLIEVKLYPPVNINIIRFDMTPSDWGCTVLEADSVDDIMRYYGAWRQACPGVFKSTKIAPASPVQNTVEVMADIIKKLT